MAMEDFRVDVVVGKGPGATAIPLEINPFTLVGATTRAGLLTGPLRDRFGFVGQMEFYEPAELQLVLARSAGAARGRADRRRLRGDRRPVARHTPHRQPAAAPGARLRRGGGRRPGHPRGRPGRAGAVRRRRARAGPARPRGPRGAGRPLRRRPGRASRRSRSPSARSRTPSRRCASRSWCAPGCWPARPRGRVATEAAWRHLGYPLPKGGVPLGGGLIAPPSDPTAEPLFDA